MTLATLALCWAGLVGARMALASGGSTAWTDLWRTPDQQGQALLDAGEPAQAAARFHDPRRRAYADLQARRYPQAAKLLAPFTDAQSEYNRGNALARSGQLQAALAAYDAALKQAPADKDIRHNRDLVERALRQPQQSPQSQGQPGSQGGRQPRQSGQRNKSGAQRPDGSKSNSGGQTASNGSRTGAGHAGGSSGQQQPGSPQAAGAHGSGSSKDSPGQARRDAAFAAAMARRQQRRGGAGNPSQTQSSQRHGASNPGQQGAGKPASAANPMAGGARTPKQKPESERQLALDQWLRQIPDSPAGLLRRKFLIEHMMKQQDGGSLPEDGR